MFDLMVATAAYHEQGPEGVFDFAGSAASAALAAYVAKLLAQGGKVTPAGLVATAVGIFVGGLSDDLFFDEDGQYDAMRDWLDQWGEKLISEPLIFPESADPAILTSVWFDFDSAFDWVPRRDPLVLDLDGDGIETIAADGSVLFDHDGDGIKHGTGWIGAADGMLVLDRNGNGLIDNGGELFGDNTPKADGTVAVNGFDALGDFDTNSDGLVDAADAQFADLRIWRDLSADGVSQGSELFTLSGLGIASIGTASEVSTLDVGNANIASAQGAFTYTTGAEGVAGSAASLDLAANTFYREFPDTIAVPTELQHLPDLKGSGAVRDLQEAAG